MLFTEVQPTLENYWRSIILFGRNVASYKFALGKSLLELSKQGREIVTLDDRRSIHSAIALHEGRIWPNCAWLTPVALLMPHGKRPLRSCGS